MSLKITIGNIEDVTRTLKDLEKNLRNGLKGNLRSEVINKSLDKILAADLTALKAELMNSLNNDMKSKVLLQGDKGEIHETSMKKSDQEMVKHLTGVDLTVVSKTKEYNTLADGKVAVVANKALDKAMFDQRNGGPTSNMSSGVNLRIPMSPSDSFENQYAQALDYFNGALFVIVDNNGKAQYYQNPGIDMTPYVKVVCSTDTGDTAKSKQRWDFHRDARGYADWTLLREGVQKIKYDFINITDVIDKVKNGEPEEAKSILTRVSQKSTKESNIIEKIDDFKEGTNLDPATEAYATVVNLLKSLQISREIAEDRTIYSLVSTYNEDVADYSKFQELILNQIKMWKITNKQKWIDQVIKSILQLVEKLLR